MAAEYLSFVEVAHALNVPVAKVRQLVLNDKQIQATRITPNGTVLHTSIEGGQDTYDLDLNCKVDDEGRITAELFELEPNGRTESSQSVAAGCLYIKRDELNAFVAASGRGSARKLGVAASSAFAENKDASPVSTRERATLLKLVIGMAIKGYRYDPKAPKNTSIQEIVDDLALLDISIDTDTVRKYLKEGANTVLPAKP